MDADFAVGVLDGIKVGDAQRAFEQDHFFAAVEVSCRNFRQATFLRHQDRTARHIEPVDAPEVVAEMARAVRFVCAVEGVHLLALRDQYIFLLAHAHHLHLLVLQRHADGYQAVALDLEQRVIFLLAQAERIAEALHRTEQRTQRVARLGAVRLRRAFEQNVAGIGDVAGACAGCAAPPICCFSSSVSNCFCCSGVRLSRFCACSGTVANAAVSSRAAILFFMNRAGAVEEILIIFK
ncbi:hypothetical protein ASF04_02650 [Duganella sp. Leaf61]|uniref:hypothetical protein n=1 Tax=Duganella sp. Leaf61 TaxID=1736227 RepID=UPI0006F5DF67|nr:hypothetical protein [Duganella sp. Leaf61]KQN79407.1 hypothetical protein ASF04_02650 [Duganella sp. Leaf61]